MKRDSSIFLFFRVRGRDPQVRGIPRERRFSLNPVSRLLGSFSLLKLPETALFRSSKGKKTERKIEEKKEKIEGKINIELNSSY